MTDKKWFVIEKTSYGTSGDNFAISKVADTVEQATTFKVHLDALNESKNKFLSALTLLEDSKHITWHIVKHDFNEPLILTEEVA